MISAARSRSIARGLASAAVVSLVLGSAAPARGQEGGGEVLHEFIERPVDLPDPPRRPSAGAPPQERADRPGRRPRLTLARRSGEMVLGASGPAYQSLRSPYGPLDPRGGRVRLDAQTSRVGGLDYHAVFKPSVYPYKRGVAQNRVHVADDGYQMSAQSGRLREVTIGGSPPEGADVFWGSFLVRARSGHLHPVPSVAPSQRVLAVETEPQAGVDVLRDEADNFYLEIDHDGLVRVNLRVAAPTFYFDGALDRSVRWRDFRGLEQTSLPEPLRAPAREALATTGVSRRSSPRRAVRRLVRYFRSFEVRALPTSARSGDLLTTIVERKVGVCRHRSMAFVVLARRLGVPARYVYNEAHAFVEIGWPGRGWRRIDLGGAAGDLRFSGARNSRLHRGSATDSLPRPPGYRSVAGGGRGEEERAERAGPRGDRAGESNERSPRSEASRRAEEPKRTGDGGSREGGDRRRTELTLQVESARVYRGEPVQLQGQLVAGRSARPVEGATVEVRIGRHGAPVEQMSKLGQTSTDASGRYSLTVEVPKTLEIGRWSLVAYYAGDERLAPSEAR